MNEKRYVDLNKAVDIGYLGDWYQSSIDTTVLPIWTEEHLEELCNDFIIIPKDTTPANVSEIQYGKWIEDGDCFHCSICNEAFGFLSAKCTSNYCPNCGAKMKKSNKNI